MREYPKVPRYDHPVVGEDFFAEGPLYITEKGDGSNFRFMLYEDRFAEEYDDEDLALDPTDGDLIFGTKSALRGTDSTPIDDFDGNLRRAARFLAEEVDKDQIREIHDESGPTVFFCENMVYHTLDYEYAESPPPALLGFDVYVQREGPTGTPPANPYEETFEGFLKTPTALRLFENIGVPPVESPADIPAYDGGEIDPAEFTIPESQWADVQAEGVVIRHPERNQRVKIVRDEFKELNKEIWGPSEHNAEDNNELFVAMFCPQSRIRKMVQKMVRDEGEEFSRAIIEDLRHRVYDDVWEEEWREIKDLDFAFNPQEVKHLITKQCRNTVMQMEQNAALNDAPVETLWNAPTDKTQTETDNSTDQ